MTKFEIELKLAELIDEQQSAEAEKNKLDERIQEIESEKVRLEKMLEGTI